MKKFYSVKGTSLVFDYMKKYLGIKFKGNITYTVSEVIFDIEDVTVKNLQYYIESLKSFLSSLLYYGDLIAEINKMNLILDNTIDISVGCDIQQYKEYHLSEVFKLD